MQFGDLTTYTVGVKRRFLPGYRKFRVTAHVTTAEHKLVLTLAAGGYVEVPNVDNTEVRFYPDFDAFTRERDRRAVEAERFRANEEAIRADERRRVAEERVEAGRFYPQQAAVAAQQPYPQIQQQPGRPTPAAMLAQINPQAYAARG